MAKLAADSNCKSERRKKIRHNTTQEKRKRRRSGDLVLASCKKSKVGVVRPEMERKKDGEE